LSILVLLYNNVVLSRSVVKVPTLSTNAMTKAAVAVTTSPKPTSSAAQLPEAVKLLIGVGGIYAAFLYYGTLQEDVFHFKAADGSMFKAAWFLQFLGSN
jgi:UDP-galactose transporter B1